MNLNLPNSFANCLSNAVCRLSFARLHCLFNYHSQTPLHLGMNNIKTNNKIYAKPGKASKEKKQTSVSTFPQSLLPVLIPHKNNFTQRFTYQKLLETFQVKQNTKKTPNI